MAARQISSSLAAGFALAASIPLLFTGGCEQRSTTGAAPAASSAAPGASASAPAPADRAALPGEQPGSDELLPVYPVDTGPPDPLAQRYCDTVHLLTARRTAECCGTSPDVAAIFAQQCVRTLTFVLGHHAATLAPKDLDRCAEALTSATSGCDWVTESTPPIPAACLGIIKGALAEKAPCRSSLECTDGLRCLGLSTIDPGTCGPPKASGTLCNIAVDTLAAFTRQDTFAREHAECQGQCSRSVCMDAVAVGGACAGDASCGKNRCVDGKCSSAPLPAAGEPCSGGACASGARCVKGKCAVPKAEGDACESNAECRGQCDHGDGGTAGKCQKQCLVLKMPVMPVAKPGARPPPKRR